MPVGRAVIDGSDIAPDSDTPERDRFEDVLLLERLRRAKVLGRTNRKKQSPDTRKPPTRFKLAAPEQAYDDPKQQAEYLYSLIESEAR